MIVKFIDVGRNKRTWEATCPASNFNDIEYGWLYSQVKKRAFIMSEEIEFIMLKGSATEGFITAGFHTIGKFEIRKGN